MPQNDTQDSGSDRAPTVYLRDGTPVKPRLIGAECVGEVAGEAVYGYTRPEEPENPALVFEKADVSDDKTHICPTCWRAFDSERAWAEHYLESHPWMYQLGRIIHGGKRRIRRALHTGR